VLRCVVCCGVLCVAVLLCFSLVGFVYWLTLFWCIVLLFGLPDVFACQKVGLGAWYVFGVVILFLRWVGWSLFLRVGGYGLLVVY